MASFWVLAVIHVSFTCLVEAGVGHLSPEDEQRVIDLFHKSCPPQEEGNNVAWRRSDDGNLGFGRRVRDIGLGFRHGLGRRPPPPRFVRVGPFPMKGSSSWGPPSTTTTPAPPQFNIHCKSATEDYWDTIKHKVVVPQGPPSPGQILFVSPPAVHYKHQIWLNQNEVGNGQKTKIYVLPQKASHQIQTHFKPSDAVTPNKPSVFFLKNRPEEQDLTSYGAPQQGYDYRTIADGSNVQNALPQSMAVPAPLVTQFHSNQDSLQGQFSQPQLSYAMPPRPRWSLRGFPRLF